jgi:hypothetical protein
MHRTSLIATISLTAAAVLGLGSGAPALAASGNQLVCFDGASEMSGNGVCHLNAKGATLKNPGAGDYSGVYVQNDNLQGKALSAVKNLSFHFTRDVAGGAPRFSLAIDADNDGSYDFFAFADPNGCGSAAPKSGVVNIITKGVANPNCQITTNNGGTFADYTAFEAAYADAVYAVDQVSFVIADQPGSYRVAQVRFNAAAAHAK